jgi:hypothetical protein
MKTHGEVARVVCCFAFAFRAEHRCAVVSGLFLEVRNDHGHQRLSRVHLSPNTKLSLLVAFKARSWIHG